MTPEERSLLERTYKIVQENNSILRSLRRSNRYSLVFKVVYWGVIIVVSLGAYFAIQPYFQSVVNAYSAIQGDATTSHTILDSLKGYFAPISTSTIK